MREDQNIEDLFRASFENFEVTPPPSVKTVVDKEINGWKRKRIWWISSFALLLLTLSGWMFFVNSATTGNKKILTAKQSFRQVDTNAFAATHSTQGLQNADQPEDNSTATHKWQHSTPENTEKFTSEIHQKPKKSQQASQFEMSKNKRPKNVSKELVVKTKNKETRPKTPSSKSAKQDNLSTGGTFNGDINASQGKGITSSGNSKLYLKGRKVLEEVQSPVAVKLASLKKQLPSSNPLNDQVNKSVDSTNGDSNTNDGTDSNEPEKKNWMTSFYAGPQWGLNTVTDNPVFEFKEKPSLYFSAEISRNLFKGFGVTTGAGFHARSENMTYNQFSYDSVYVGMDSTAIPDPNNPDSIIGYDYFDVYQIDTTKVQQTNNYSFQSVTVPLFINRHFSFSEQWGMLVNAGAVFQFNNIKNTKENVTPAPLPNRFTISPMLRVHATYTVNNWMFSAGLNTGIDLRNAIDYSGVDRKRFFLTPQLGVHFRF